MWDDPSWPWILAGLASIVAVGELAAVIAAGLVAAVRRRWQADAPPIKRRRPGRTT